jgi:hypothetical protein
MNEAICKGSLLLGTACQKCDKCRQERDEIADKLRRLEYIESGIGIDEIVQNQIDSLKKYIANRDNRLRMVLDALRQRGHDLVALADRIGRG